MNLVSRTVCCLIALLVVASLPLRAWGTDPTRHMVTEAVDAYQTAMNAAEPDQRIEGFSTAYRLFAQAIETGETNNADLYTNLGNSALQAQRLGPAILAYRRALAIEPGHARAAKNLAHARSLLPNWVPTPDHHTLVDTFLFWTRMFSIPSQAVAASVFFAAASMLFAVAIRWKRRWAANLGIVPLVIWAAMTASMLWHVSRTGDVDVVVVAHEAVGRSADASGSPPRFAEPLPSGTEAQLIEQRNGWAHVRLANGREAWLRRATLEPVQ